MFCGGSCQLFLQTERGAISQLGLCNDSDAKPPARHSASAAGRRIALRKRFQELLAFPAIGEAPIAAREGAHSTPLRAGSALIRREGSDNRFKARIAAQRVPKWMETQMAIAHLASW